MLYAFMLLCLVTYYNLQYYEHKEHWNDYTNTNMRSSSSARIIRHDRWNLYDDCIVFFHGHSRESECFFTNWTNSIGDNPFFYTRVMGVTETFTFFR
jgi:hypothetical protein